MPLVSQILLERHCKALNRGSSRLIRERSVQIRALEQRIEDLENKNYKLEKEIWSHNGG